MTLETPQKIEPLIKYSFGTKIIKADKIIIYLEASAPLKERVGFSV